MERSVLPGTYQYPPGFRFHPTDQELVLHYLSKKVTGTLSLADSIVADVDFYKFNPWELPEKAFFGDGEWFFFSPRERKYPHGSRPNRAAGRGYWKATGTDKPILAADGIQCLGVKKALVFYEGRPPKGTKTDWVMNEYRLLDRQTSWSQKHKGTMKLDDWVLCRVRQKGSFAPQGNEEKQDNPNLSQALSVKQAERQGESMAQWNDYQLLAYLMGSPEEGESGCANSDPGSSAKSSSDKGNDGLNSSGCAGLIQPNTVSFALNSIKRNLSFGALDEIMLYEPATKRPNCYNQVVEQMSPSGSFSVDQVYLI